MAHTPASIRRTTVATGLGVLLSAALAAGVPAAATAASYGVDDPAGDVETFQRDGSTTPRPDLETVDLTRVSYDYRRQVLVLVATARDVGGRVQPIATINPARGRSITYIGTQDGRLSTYSRVGPRPCPDGSVSRNDRRLTYRVRIPASCLGAPPSLRVTFALMRADQANYSTTSDDVLDGDRSPRIRRG